MMALGNVSTLTWDGTDLRLHGLLGIFYFSDILIIKIRCFFFYFKHPTSMYSFQTILRVTD